MFQGDFARAITTCEHLQHVIPKRSFLHVEVLSLLGLAHAALQHYQESYDLFTEALTIDPTNAELWYNRGLASQCVTRVGQSVRDFERAVELSKNDKGDMALMCAEELAKSRQSVADDMKEIGEQIMSHLSFLKTREQDGVPCSQRGQRPRWEQGTPSCSLVFKNER